MASLLAQGGAGAIANSSTSAAPITLYDQATDVDAGACEAYSVVNTGTTDGTTLSTDWLWVRLFKMHSNVGQAFPILPGERHLFKIGNNYNGITKIVAWTTLAGQGPTGTAAGGNVMVAGGIFAQN